LREPLPSAHCYISIITEIELLSYPLLSSESEAEIHDFLADVTVIDLSQEIKQATINLRRQYRFKLPDAVIVATARHLDAELLTNDLKLSKTAGVSVRALQLKDEHE
jgi:PIN domain.